MLGRGLKLKASNHVVSVSRMGKPRDGRPRLLKVQLRSVEGKGEVLKRAKNLKQNEDFGKVFIVPDLTKNQQKVDKDLRDKLKEFRSKGEQASIRGGKVIKNEEGKQVVLYRP